MRRRPEPTRRTNPALSPPTAILLGCVKTKVHHPAAAKDLYCSPLWARRRAYAEASGRPWVILSAMHGLVEPERRLRPYDRALNDVPAGQRREWGVQVATSLRECFGTLTGKVFEVQAGAAYRDAIVGPLARSDASITNPLVGLSMGRQLSWYAARAEPARRRTSTPGEVRRRALHDLDAAPKLIAARNWPGPARGLDHAGLYSWWVDAAGAKDLTRGLGQRVRAGRIYAGLTGATKWPSGKTNSRSLGARIGGGHLHGSISSSTFRRTLAAVLAAPLGLVTNAPGKLDRESEQRLSAWMAAHLRVAVHPFAERDALGDLEKEVLATLDPPLNLDAKDSTPLRRALSQLRAGITSGL